MLRVISLQLASAYSYESCSEGQEADNLAHDRATFSENISCNLTLYQVLLGELIPSLADLSGICNDACLNDLEALRADQLAECTSSDLVVTGGVSYPATYTTDLLLFTYNYTCLVDP
jgi:hypothetical protein